MGGECHEGGLVLGAEGTVVDGEDEVVVADDEVTVDALGGQGHDEGGQVPVGLAGPHSLPVPATPCPSVVQLQSFQLDLHPALSVV